MSAGASLEARLWSRVRRGGPDDCWPWTGALADGHGHLREGVPSRRFVRAHRVAWGLLVGAIPPGLGLDHLCHNRDLGCPGGRSCVHRRCVNPAHLEPVRARENILRSPVALAAVNARKTACIRGHLFAGENLGIEADGRRVCRTCRRDRSRAATRRRVSGKRWRTRQ